ncbi:glutathione S-transferase N-terminal domain-containing protein [Hyphomonas pacifica]|uniref:Uncharacterized protein n=1 Tax=Hyphomonas pacifica TaxID=1280941 RepID=A0A062TNF2_9PROT|nr:glutathione S-transferase N-terminal domain-containing protein [Hyphomonas pacifica]KCZ46761.1 hypothetical protein HY2_05070 [Hyphomonas pacifica]RAN30377.1 hypothetical protein HY3_06040 [Hyphomonas pacifica]
MKLHYSLTSPYARKVRVVIIEHDMEDEVEMVKANSMAEGAAEIIHNPLSKIPSLILKDGSALYDSPVICEYLDHEAGGKRLLPKEGSRRWSVLRAQALGDGILDAAIGMVIEGGRPEGQRSGMWQERWTGAIHRSVDQIAEEVAEDPKAFDLGLITYVCALGYLDFRLPDLDWRAPHPDLAEWYEELSARESFARTRPPEE